MTPAGVVERLRSGDRAPALINEAISLLEKHAAPLAERDRLLRAAGELVSGSINHRAKVLRAIVRGERVELNALADVVRLVREAVRAADFRRMPKSTKQFDRILRHSNVKLDI